MLVSLSIKNILIVSSSHMEFAPGLNIVSGETGAGKSILLDCISFALGNKAGSLTVKNGENKGHVIVVFDISNMPRVKNILNENDLEIDSDELVIRRTISADSGRSSAFINDQQIAVQILQKIGVLILEMYGQHDFSNLLDSSQHLNLLDEYSELQDSILELSVIYDQYKAIEKEINDIHKKAEDAKREEDYLRFIESEIASANILKGEESELVEKRNILKNSQHITDGFSSILGKINSAEIINIIYSSQRELIKISNNFEEGDIAQKINKISDSFEKSAIELEEASEELNSILMDVGYQDENIDDVEDRLYAIRELARKHRKNVDELPDYLEEIRSKLNLINSTEENLDSLNKAKDKAFSKYKSIADKISKKRKESAKILEQKIAQELPSLNMPGCKFIIQVDKIDNDKFNSRGFDKVVFTAATNPGQPYSEISKTASGGELSRLMLALKLALSEKVGSETVIFDEVDTGIGGATAEAIGLRLKRLSENIQLLCITHQPQVASKNDRHFKVFKEIKENSPISNVIELDEEQSNEEIARMLSGLDITDEARAAAKRLKG